MIRITEQKEPLEHVTQINDCVTLVTRGPDETLVSKYFTGKLQAHIKEWYIENGADREFPMVLQFLLVLLFRGVVVDLEPDSIKIKT